MNKLAIPTILLATVMVAGLFAFAPVEQASTVHGTITNAVDGVADTQFNQGTTYFAVSTTTAVEATSTADFMLTVCFTDNVGTNDFAVINDGANNIAAARSIDQGITGCVTVGGQGGDIYTITTTTGGDDILYATLQTTSDADASMEEVED